jgi:hypothetical protein
MSQRIYDSLQARYDLLDDCTARVELANSNGHGSGFFVASNLFITCFHVIEKATTDSTKSINIVWKGQSYTRHSARRRVINEVG